MNSVTEAKLRQYLTTRLGCGYFDTGTILERMHTLARVGGYDLDRRFASAGLGSGPEGRIAAAIVDRALGGGGGSAASPDLMKKQIDHWKRTMRTKGR